MVEIISSRVGTLQKWAFPPLALAFGVSGIASLGNAPVGSAVMFLGTFGLVFAWCTVVRKYRKVVDLGDEIIVGEGANKFRVPKNNIQAVKSISGLKTPVFKVTAQTTDGLVSFYFTARRGVTDRSVIEIRGNTNTIDEA